MKKYIAIAFCTAVMVLSPTFAMAAPNTDTEAAIGNAAVAETINKEIENKNENLIDDENHKSIHTTFETKYQQNDILSFVITTTESQASTSVKKYYYNIDLKTGQSLTLQGLLGNDYEKIVNASIHNQIKQRMSTDENQIFFGFSEDDKEMGIEGFTGITNNQSFFINEKGNVVITFPQFEIAPGYMGIPEFEIQK